MNKKIKFLLLGLLCAGFSLLSNHASAQWGLGVGISTQKFTGDASGLPMSFGLDVGGHFIIKEKYRLEAGIIYYLPSQVGDDNDNLKVSTFNLHVNGQYPLVGKFTDDENFLLYAIVGVSFNFYSATATSAGVSESESSEGTNFNLGIGAAYPLSEVTQVYFEPKFILGTGNYNSQTGGNFSASYASWINVGFRFKLGGD